MEGLMGVQRSPGMGSPGHLLYSEDGYTTTSKVCTPKIGWFVFNMFQNNYSMVSCSLVFHKNNGKQKKMKASQSWGTGL